MIIPFQILSLPQSVPDEIKELVETCWQSDPDLRPEFEEIVERIEEMCGTLKPQVTQAAANGCCTLQ